MKYSIRILGFIVSLSLLAPSISPAQSAGRQQLHGHVPDLVLKKAPLLGHVPSSKVFHLSFGLPLRNTQELQVLVQQLYDPKSPQYRHWLSVEDFTSRFGPSASDYQAVQEFAKAHNLTVDRTFANRMVVSVSGAAGDVENALNVQLNRYQRPDGTEFFSPDREPSLDLAAALSHVGGLDNAHPPRPAGLHRAAANKTKPVAATGSAPDGNYWGNDFRNAYCPGVTLTGAGQVNAIMSFDTYYPSDIPAYISQAGIAANAAAVTNLFFDGLSPSATPVVEETVLDIEDTLAVAPGLAQLRMYMAPDTVSGDDLLNAIVSDNLAKVTSASWIFGVDTTESQDLTEMEAQGQSFFIASGDDGAWSPTCNNGLACSEDLMNEQPNLTVVGGTELTDNGTGGSWAGEVAWPGSAGGISPDLPIPSYQAGVNMGTNGGSTTNRNIPDVALVATNVEIVFNGSQDPVGGTSCAAPLWNGFTALVNQQAALQGNPPVGFVNPALYQIGEGSHYGFDLHDIQSGNNPGINNATGNNAVPGYDLVTGWGSPAGQFLIDDLARVAFPTPTMTPTPTPTPPCTTQISLQLLEFTSCSSSTPSETFEVINNGAAVINLSDVVIKYWADDTTGQALVGSVNYGGCYGFDCASAMTGVVVTATNFSPACGPDPTNQANWEMAISNTSTGQLGQGQTWGNLQIQTHLSNYGALSPGTADWYSPCNVGGGTTYTDDIHYALYYQGNLVTTSGGAPPSCRPYCTPGTLTPGLTPSPTNTPTRSMTPTATSSPTLTVTRTPTASATASRTPTASFTTTETPSLTATASPAHTATFTPTGVLGTATSTPTGTRTSTATATPSLTVTASPTATVSTTATFTPTRPAGTATSTPTRTASSTATASPTGTRATTATPSNTPSGTASSTPTRTVTLTATATITPTTTPSPTSTPAVTATPTATGGTACGTSSLDLQLEEFGACGSNQNQETFEVINKGTSAVTLSDITIKFWADDTTGTAMVGAVNYGGCFGQTCTAVTGTAINTLNFSPACGPSNTQQANWEITLSNTDTATLGAGITWANLQTAVHLSSFANFSPGTGFWYSPCNVGSGSTYTNNLNYALYVRGDLVTASGGVPPSCRPLPTCTPSGAVVRSLDLALHGETPTPSAVAKRGTGLSVVAAPNISRDGQPIRFQVTLGQFSPLELDLFSLTGEKVFEAQAQGEAGSNTITWELTNSLGENTASGLYIYIVRAGDSIQTGKVVVIH